jgi:Phage integrase family
VPGERLGHLHGDRGRRTPGKQCLGQLDDVRWQRLLRGAVAADNGGEQHGRAGASFGGCSVSQGRWRPSARLPEGDLRRASGSSPDPLQGLLRDDEPGRSASGSTRIEPLVREWLMDLQVLGRSQRTIRWYGQKMDWYLRNGGVQTIEAILRAAPEGWPRIAILVLLGTGMRVSELCALKLDDVEDEDEAAFLKIQRGKGGKLRRRERPHPGAQLTFTDHQGFRFQVFITDQEDADPGTARGPSSRPRPESRTASAAATTLACAASPSASSLPTRSGWSSSSPGCLPVNCAGAVKS